MKKSIYFQIDNFITEVIKAMKLNDIDAFSKMQLRQMIEEKIADRIIMVILNHFGTKEAERFEKLLEDHPEMSEIDALLIMAPEIKGLKEGLDKQISSLYAELVYDAERVDKALTL